MDALIASYGDSDSDTESKSPRLSIPLPPPSLSPSPLPPPPISLLTPPNSFFGTLDDLQTVQAPRVRSFPHVDGNYAVHVYIPGEGEDELAHWAIGAYRTLWRAWNVRKCSLGQEKARWTCPKDACCARANTLPVCGLSSQLTTRVSCSQARRAPNCVSSLRVASHAICFKAFRHSFRLDSIWLDLI
ncbi:hypothetical protein SOVF_106120 [Spinacia oleracea]|nr:hypothetical protein SOVF_106120 [Spinacia oleracea]